MPTVFEKVLVPFDGSEASLVALDYGIALAKAGAHLFVLHVIDDGALVAETAAAETGFDPTDFIEALERQGRAMLDAAARRSRAASVDAATEVVHGSPVPSILATRTRLGCDLVVLGTHGRAGLARVFHGSTTEGVLRMSHAPVLTVRAEMHKLQGSQLFRRAIVALADSGPAEAALKLAAKLARSTGTEVMPCIAIDTHHIHDMAVQYGYAPQPLISDLFAEAQEQVKPMTARLGLGTREPTVVEGEVVSAILGFAEQRDADVIVMGSHGRSGLSRLVLGSVAEGVVRRSPIPVLVVRQ